MGTAAIVGASLTRIGFAADVDEYGGLPMGIQSYTLRSVTFDKMLDAMQNDLKLHYVELFGNHLPANSTPTKLEAARKRLAAAGVKAVSYGVNEFTKDHEQNRKLFEFAKSMGMTNLSADPKPDSFDSLDKLVEEYKISIAIHNHGPGHHYGKIEQIENAIKDHHKMIGACVDTGHFIRSGVDPMDACKAFKDRLYAVHLKDFKKDAAGKFEDCVLAEGSMPIDGVIKFLMDMKFTGATLIEYEGEEPVAATLKSLARVKEAVKKA
jgi:sugar phosphate isomerase/epimerase